MTPQRGQVVMFKFKGVPARVIGVGDRALLLESAPFTRHLALPHEVAPMRQDMDRLVSWDDCAWMTKEMRA